MLLRSAEKKCLSVVLLLLSSSGLTTAGCFEPSPAFPLPHYDAGSQELQIVFSEIEQSVKKIVSADRFDTSSFSVEVTSSEQTLWSLHHDARVKDEERPGTAAVNGSSVYRIASITKVFTVLAVINEHVAGRLDLDDSIDDYIPELKLKQSGTIPWKDITLRTLASQLSGIPNDWAQSDLLNEFPDPLEFGFPPSNTAFELLGLVLENVTGRSYAECIASRVTDPIGMNSTSLEKPPDAVGVIPKGNNYWDVDEGVQNPTGGLYSSSTDLSAFLRWILRNYNGLTPTLNWLHPASYSYGMHSFYGTPWEIFRTTSILPETQRPVTFVTKGGGLPAYFSIIMALPEYDLGVTILVGGESDLLDELKNAVTVPLVQVAEVVGHQELQRTYAGNFSSLNGPANLNSSMVITQSAHRGLHVTQWISNGTDVFEAFGPLIPELTGQKGTWRAQLVPTLLFRDEERQHGEIWRVEIVPERTSQSEQKVWDDFCITHIDNVRYAGLPLNEVVFWGKNSHGQVEEVELSAFRTRLQRKEKGGSGELPAGFLDRMTQRIFSRREL